MFTYIARKKREKLNRRKFSFLYDNLEVEWERESERERERKRGSPFGFFIRVIEDHKPIYLNDPGMQKRLCTNNKGRFVVISFEKHLNSIDFF